MTAYAETAGATGAWSTPTVPTATTPTAAQDAGQPELKPIVGPLKAAVVAVGIAVGVLGALGFVNSFHRVDTSAQPSFHGLAWSVPIGIDLAIGIFSALDIVLAMLEMRLFWLRFIPWVLTYVTVRLNIDNQPGQPALTGFDKLAHGVLPALWALSVEVGAHVVRKRAHLASDKRMDRVRSSRWLLAPVPTMRLWRRMVLWEERSYPAALVRERDRVLAKTDLQDAYGLLWRFKAPRRARALYRLGALAPAAIADSITAGVTQPESAPEPEPAEQASASESAEAFEPAANSVSGEAAEAAGQVSQDSGLVLPDDSAFAEVVASLPRVTQRPYRPRRTVVAAAPARRQASVTAKVGVNRDSVERVYRDSVAAGAPMSSWALAAATGVSQSTATRTINAVNKTKTSTKTDAGEVASK